MTTKEKDKAAYTLLVDILEDDIFFEMRGRILDLFMEDNIAKANGISFDEANRYFDVFKREASSLLSSHFRTKNYEDLAAQAREIV